MAMSLLEAPTGANPSQSLRLSQQAPAYLKSQSTWSLPYPLSLLANNESQEKWQSYENLFLACLRTGDNATAFKMIEQMKDRFGEENDRVLALRGLYEEATATDAKKLDSILKSYEEILKDDPTSFTIRKRRIALLRATGKVNDAIAGLANLLDTSPTDVESWAELADCYQSQGAFEQAVFCLEEVLLITPNAWNMHAKLGEVIYLSALRSESAGDQSKLLAESMRRFCRSIELCDDFLRGFYGLKLTTNRLLTVTADKKAQNSSDLITSDLTPPPKATVQRLNELATAKLAEILRRTSAGEKGWDGYNQAELAAARELLEQDTPKIER